MTEKIFSIDLEDIEFTRKTPLNKGWYQNTRGELFVYDGVVWDNVPNDKLTDLEFLGGRTNND